MRLGNEKEVTGRNVTQNINTWIFLKIKNKMLLDKVFAVASVCVQQVLKTTGIS